MDDTTLALGVATNCHNNVGMTDDATSWQRLGRLVVHRRTELGYRRREDLAELPGVSLRTLGDIETGRRTGYHRNTIAALENALRWTAGSVDQILAGGEPTPRPAQHTRTVTDSIGLTDEVTVRLENEEDDDPVVKIMADPRLTQKQKAQVIRQVLAEQRAFARQRADELLRAAYQNGEQG